MGEIIKNSDGYEVAKYLFVQQGNKASVKEISEHFGRRHCYDITLGVVKGMCCGNLVELDNDTVRLTKFGLGEFICATLRN